MKKYRNKVKGPVPVGLKSGSISVPSKGYFNVDGDDLNSPDLLTKIRTGKVKYVEEVIVTIIPDEGDANKKEEKVSKETPVTEASGSVSGDVKKDEKVADSLTSSPEMVESKETEKNENAENTSTDDGESTDVDKSKHGRRRKNKKGITG